MEKREKKKCNKELTDTKFHCWDQHTSKHLQWDFQTKEKKETSFIRRKDREWRTIKAAAIFKKNMPDEEIELWVRLTNRELIKNKKPTTNLVEMYRFIACILVLMHAQKKGGITQAFNENNDGLFPASNLRCFGLKHWHWKENFQH
eukprot:1681576-Ditylum_brightwellii.AAC.1